MNFKRRWSDRERIILRAAVNQSGQWTTKTLAAHLNLSIHTVRKQAEIFRRMGFLKRNIHKFEATELGRRKWAEFGGDDNHV